MNRMMTVDARSTQAQAWGITALRVAVGITFLMHGWQKLTDMGIAGTATFFGKLGVPAPELAAMMVTAVEIVGGIALIVGLASRWAVIPLAADMLAALFMFHLRRGFFVGEGGGEHAMLLLAGLVVLALYGSGALSVDGLVQRLRADRVPTTEVMRPLAVAAGPD
jgi:putative oxidoreductase